MGSIGSYLFVYFLGGLTFLPLVLSLVLLFVYLTLPSATLPSSSPCDRPPLSIQSPSDDQYSLKSGTDELAEKFLRTHDSDVAAGYFAVCREYVPGGVNGKPPERTTPAGEVIVAESPSVYQAMYRSLFDRKQSPTIDPPKNNTKNNRKARNVFYIVLRHGHLMLYDDANQVEVRYVISLAHHDVTIHGPEGEIPEGELWLKRNAICLSRRLESLGDLGGPTPPFFLFSENLSEKEDFYFAMLQNQSKMWDSPDAPPQHQLFDTKHIVTLVQRLHSSEEQLQTRWINAVLGRLFLALYRTPEMEEFIRSKITKKISRVNKPNFISKIGLQRIELGEGAPFIINPRLKDLTVDGNCCVETDVQYTGKFRVEVSATVRIDLGPRFKAREVDIMLAVVLKKLEGHLLIRFKPPPSNRAWISFETMPNMVMDIQPIVSSKQITYGIILRNIENRIREVVAESLVQPFWDDIPFLDTLSQRFRGGIWKQETPQQSKEENIPDESVALPSTPSDATSESVGALKTKGERAMSAPALSEPAPVNLKSRKGSKDRTDGSSDKDRPSALSSSVERPGGSPPRAIRSQTFSNAADPVVTADHVKMDKVAPESKQEEKSSATSAMIEISSRSPPESPGKGTPPTEALISPDSMTHSRDSSITESIENVGGLSSGLLSRHPSNDQTNDSLSNLGSPANSSTTSLGNNKHKRRSTLETFTRTITSSNSPDNRSQASISIGNATSAAKKWGWNMFAKTEQTPGQEAHRPAGTPQEPIGRGHPLPPPGTPLPRPAKFGFKSNSSTTVPRRKPLPPQLLPERFNEENRQPQGPLPQKKPVLKPADFENQPEELLVVEAPYDSDSNSPVVDIPCDTELSKMEQPDISPTVIDSGDKTTSDDVEDRETPGQDSMGQDSDI